MKKGGSKQHYFFIKHIHIMQKNGINSYVSHSFNFSLTVKAVRIHWFITFALSDLIPMNQLKRKQVKLDGI